MEILIKQVWKISILRSPICSGSILSIRKSRINQAFSWWTFSQFWGSPLISTKASPVAPRLFGSSFVLDKKTLSMYIQIPGRKEQIKSIGSGVLQYVSSTKAAWVRRSCWRSLWTKGLPPWLLMLTLLFSGYQTLRKTLALSESFIFTSNKISMTESFPNDDPMIQGSIRKGAAKPQTIRFSCRSSAAMICKILRWSSIMEIKNLGVVHAVYLDQLNCFSGPRKYILKLFKRIQIITQEESFIIKSHFIAAYNAPIFQISGEPLIYLWRHYKAAESEINRIRWIRITDIGSGKLPPRCWVSLYRCVDSLLIR